MGFIYIIQQGNTNNYKIGYSNDPQERCKQLQTGNPQKLHLKEIFDCRNSSVTDHTIHNYLSNFNIKIPKDINSEFPEGKNSYKNTEWFYIEPEDYKNVCDRILYLIEHPDIMF